MNKILVHRLADWMFERMISDAQARGDKIVDLAKFKNPAEVYMEELAEKFPKTRAAELETANTIFRYRAQMHLAKMKAEMAFDDYIVGLVKPLMDDNSELTVGEAYKLLLSKVTSTLRRSWRVVCWMRRSRAVARCNRFPESLHDVSGLAGTVMPASTIPRKKSVFPAAMS